MTTAINTPINDAALNTIFLEARSYNDWAPVPFGEAEMRAIYDLTKMGPTAGNSSPARFYWMLSDAAKQRLMPHLWEANRAKTLKASAVVVIGTDLDFPEYLDRLLPVVPFDVAKGFFSGPGIVEIAGKRNAALQGAYLMIAARALGWDIGPMSGFDHDAVDAEFFAGTPIKSNFIVNIGRGTQEGLNPRLPRLDFEEANQVF